MPEHGIRGMGPSAEESGLPQTKLDGSSFTRSTKSENNYKNDDQQFIIQIPSITLPKGGCAFSGFGKNINTNAFTGTSVITLPIYVALIRQRFQTQFSLPHDSDADNSDFAIGWRFSFPVIFVKSLSNYLLTLMRHAYKFIFI